MSDVNGPKCCCGCGHFVGQSFHKCILCQGRVRGGICFVGDGEEGVNGTCKACAKRGSGRRERESRLQREDRFPGGTIFCGHPTDSQ